MDNVSFDEPHAHVYIIYQVPDRIYSKTCILSKLWAVSIVVSYASVCTWLSYKTQPFLSKRWQHLPTQTAQIRMCIYTQKRVAYPVRRRCGFFSIPTCISRGVSYRKCSVELLMPPGTNCTTSHSHASKDCNFLEVLFCIMLCLGIFYAALK